MNDTSAANAAKKQKRITAAVIAAAAALVIGAIAFFTVYGINAMKGGGAPLPTGSVLATEAPDAEYELSPVEIRYWPEDADQMTCDYALLFVKPVFSREQTAGAAMNKAVDSYYEELCARIESRYMNDSVAKPPYTEVNCEVKRMSAYTEVVFTEQHCYEAQPYTETRVLILDARGNEVGINDVYRTYHADELLARAVLTSLEQSGRGKSGLVLNDVLAALDIRRRCLAEDSGITVYFTEGELAPYEQGELAVTVGSACLLPDFVGEALSADEYRNISALSDHLSTACIIRETNVEDGELTPYAATAFMGCAVNARGYVPQQGRILIPEQDFLSFYRGCFGREFPGLDTDGFNIKLADGSYSVLASPKEYEYHFDMFSAVREGDIVTVSGDIIFGAFGSPYTQPVCHAVLTLKANAESPYGFTVEDFVFSL